VVRTGWRKTEQNLRDESGFPRFTVRRRSHHVVVARVPFPIVCRFKLTARLYSSGSHTFSGPRPTWFYIYRMEKIKKHRFLRIYAIKKTSRDPTQFEKRCSIAIGLSGTPCTQKPAMLPRRRLYTE